MSQITRSPASACWADFDKEWKDKDVIKELKGGAWIEPGGPSGYMLISPIDGFVVLLPAFFVRHKRNFRLEWWRAGWGKKVRKTSRCRFVYNPPNPQVDRAGEKAQGEQK
jgi:hypothetical protein